MQEKYDLFEANPQQPHQQILHPVMNLHRHLLLITCIFAGTCSITMAQERFAVNPTLVTASKPADYFVFYNYSEIFNLTDDTLAMRWVKTYVKANFQDPSGSGGYGNWETLLNDPQNFYYPVNDIDSADFVLDTIHSSTDKFIFQLIPNLQSGNLITQFKLFPIDFPADSVILTFHYTATHVATSTHTSNEKEDITISPNPARQICHISNQTPDAFRLSAVDPNGSARPIGIIPGHSTLDWDCSALPPGNYFLCFENDKTLILKKLSIIP